MMRLQRKKVCVVAGTVRARYKGDRLFEALEPVALEVGKEISLTIIDVPGSAEPGAFGKAAGGWVGIVDVDAFLKDRKERRG
jgi:hypothetical protein